MRFLKHTLCFLATTLILGTAQASILDSAKMAYEKADFQESVFFYEKLVTQDSAVNSSLFYNLANAYYKNGALGKSILFFEKALKINPNNDDAAFNLALANTQIKDKFETIPEVNSSIFFRKINSVIHYETMGLVSIILLLTASSLYLYSKYKNEKKLHLIGVYASIIAIVLTFLSFKQKAAIDAYHAGVITKPAANIFSAPNENSTLLFEIHEGSKLQILNIDNNWYNIKTPSNIIGWVEASNLSKI